MAGEVFSGTRRIDKAGEWVASDAALQVRQALHPYVSRGGIKLAHALDHFALSPEGLVALDAGASTGGFTDVLLRRGATKVYAVDAGTAQLADKLRRDDRVVVMEKTNARHLTSAHLPVPPAFVTVDVSFISLTLVLPALISLASLEASFVCLIKPQFEVGKAQVGKKGVVRDPVLHEEVCRKITDFFLAQSQMQVHGVIESPITGPEGNKEFLLAARRKV